MFYRGAILPKCYQNWQENRPPLQWQDLPYLWAVWFKMHGETCLSIWWLSTECNGHGFHPHGNSHWDAWPWGCPWMWIGCHPLLRFFWHVHLHYPIPGSCLPLILCRTKFSVAFSPKNINMLVVGWYSLEQNTSWSIWQASFTVVDFIRSERD